MPVLDQPSQVDAFLQRIRQQADTRYVYTYPFKGAYRPLPPTTALAGWDGHHGHMNIYIHIPYCDMKCSFCNLLTTTGYTATSLEEYVSALCNEIALVGAVRDWTPLEVDSVYIGGGTPSVLKDAALQSVISALIRTFTFPRSPSWSIEATPDSVDSRRLSSIRALGFDRISFGIQTFDPRELRAMGRPYEPKLGDHAVASALAVGFPDVNVDLMYGLPGQSMGSWLNSLRAAISLEAPTITIYPLVFRTQTKTGRVHGCSPAAFPDGTARYAFHDAAVELLSAHHYSRYSAVGFTRLGHGCRHETNEFLGVPTLGFGAGALTYAPAVHYSSGAYANLESPRQTLVAYLSQLATSKLPARTGFILDEDERRRRAIILGLSHAGLDTVRFSSLFGANPDAFYSTEMTALRTERLVDEDSSCVRVTSSGWRVLSHIADLFASPAVSSLAATYK